MWHSLNRAPPEKKEKAFAQLPGVKSAPVALDFVNALSFGLDVVSPAAEDEETVIEELEDEPQMETLKEELDSVKEHLTETEKKLKDQEDTYKERVTKLEQDFEEERTRSQNAIHLLALQVQEKGMELKEALDEGAHRARSAQEAKEESTFMEHEWTNSKNDYQKVCDELTNAKNEYQQVRDAIYHLTLQNQQKDVKLKEAFVEGGRWVLCAKGTKQENSVLKEEKDRLGKELTNEKSKLTNTKNELANSKNDYQEVCDELTKAKNDYQKARDELNDLRLRFDDDVQSAKDEGRCEIEALRATAKKTEEAQEQKLRSLEKKVKKVINENHLLQHVIKRMCKRMRELEEASPQKRTKVMK